MQWRQPYYMSMIIILTTFLGLGSLVGQERQEAKFLGNWHDPSIIGSNNHNNAYNEVWGIAMNGHEYGIIGSTSGTHFIDVTNIDDIHEAHFVPGGAMGGIVIHRDFHTHDGFLYAVGDQGDDATLQIIDISQLPDRIEIVYDSGELSTRTHNIFIDTIADRLYLCRTQAQDLPRVAMRILDISNPTEPELIHTLTEIDGFGQVGTIHDAFVEDNIAYLHVGNQGFAIVDFSDIDNPIVMASLYPEDYAQSGFNHSGYPSEDRQYYYFADENHGRDLKAIDIRNLPDIFVTDFFDANNDSEFSIPHNQIVHDDYLYSSYYYDGLQVYDLSDPAHPVNVVHYPTSTIEHKGRFEGAWGVYPFLPSGKILVSDMQNGLFVLKMPFDIDEIDPAEDQEFILAPNPSNGEILIEALNFDATSETDIYVHTADGRLVTERTLTEAWDVLYLDPGFYMVSLKSGDNCSTQKLFVR